MGMRKNSQVAYASLVQRYIGTAYDVVKAVSDRLPEVLNLEDALGNYLGVFDNHPTTGLNGNPLEKDQFYVNSTDGLIYFRSTAEWIGYDGTGITDALIQINNGLEELANGFRNEGSYTPSSNPPSPSNPASPSIWIAESSGTITDLGLNVEAGSYLLFTPDATGNTPGSYSLMNQKGDTGAQGPQGEQGPQGPQGIAGLAGDSILIQKSTLNDMVQDSALAEGQFVYVADSNTLFVIRGSNGWGYNVALNNGTVANGISTDLQDLPIFANINSLKAQSGALAGDTKVFPNMLVRTASATSTGDNGGALYMILSNYVSFVEGLDHTITGTSYQAIYLGDTVRTSQLILSSALGAGSDNADFLTDVLTSRIKILEFDKNVLVDGFDIPEGSVLRAVNRNAGMYTNNSTGISVIDLNKTQSTTRQVKNIVLDGLYIGSNNSTLPSDLDLGAVVKGYNVEGVTINNCRIEHKGGGAIRLDECVSVDVTDNTFTHVGFSLGDAGLTRGTPQLLMHGANSKIKVEGNSFKESYMHILGRPNSVNAGANQVHINDNFFSSSTWNSILFEGNAGDAGTHAWINIENNIMGTVIGTLTTNGYVLNADSRHSGIYMRKVNSLTIRRNDITLSSSSPYVAGGCAGISSIGHKGLTAIRDNVIRSGSEGGVYLSSDSTDLLVVAHNMITATGAGFGLNVAHSVNGDLLDNTISSVERSMEIYPTVGNSSKLNIRGNTCNRNIHLTNVTYSTFSGNIVSGEDMRNALVMDNCTHMTVTHNNLSKNLNDSEGILEVLGGSYNVITSNVLLTSGTPESCMQVKAASNITNSIFRDNVSNVSQVSNGTGTGKLSITLDADTVPANSIFRKGDKLMHSAPDAGAYLGKICVTAGTSTTAVFKDFGLIEA